MKNFLLIPIDECSYLSELGGLLLCAARKRHKDVLHVRVVQSDSPEEESHTSGEETAHEVLKLETVDEILATLGVDELEDKLTDYFYASAYQAREMAIVEGFLPSLERPYLFFMNRSLAELLRADVIFVVNAKHRKVGWTAQRLQTVSHLCCALYRKRLGYILTEAGEATEQYVNSLQQILISDRVELPCLLALKGGVEGKLSPKMKSALADRVQFNEFEKALARALRPEDMMPPSVYRRWLLEKARAVPKKIVLPEGSEPRTVQAAVLCQQKKIAHCILLTKQDALEQTLKSLNMQLPEGLEVVDPDKIREQFVKPLVALRQHKGMTEQKAREVLKDDVYVATMMLQQGVVDGLVSGAVHTTADTVRPALQLIKTEHQSTLVSSVFFMLMPTEVMLFADCAVNVVLRADQLAEVAIQTADSAKAFGLEPKVGMISFSTKDSGSGASVDVVREATRLVQSKRPDILIDGPLQYDAASIPRVASLKAPDSLVAGQVNVFIFPDLNTGNTVYKAVQRTGNILSVGPMLQGLARAVNDLSRGATVMDIVFTIAITAIQAEQKLNQCKS
ncbi:MAG: phosphate acetyltransferase [Neisseriaceae bacterium]